MSAIHATKISRTIRKISKYLDQTCETVYRAIYYSELDQNSVIKSLPLLGTKRLISTLKMLTSHNQARTQETKRGKKNHQEKRNNEAINAKTKSGRVPGFPSRDS